MNAHDIAPVASPPICASCLYVIADQLLEAPLCIVAAEDAYEVWVSLLPDHMITSAGEVLVCLARS